MIAGMTINNGAAITGDPGATQEFAWSIQLTVPANTGTSALSFLNIRGVVSDVKKVIHAACQNSLFEQNTDITWLTVLLIRH